MHKTVIALLAAMGGSLLFAADTWYVDDDWFEKGGTGTEAAPFGTIQDAVDAAQAGDTIYVAEGVYDQGGKAYYDADKETTYGLNRVLIDKSLTIIGAGRGKSVIVGAYDDTVSTKCGMNAVRCVMCDPAVTDVRVEGFTLTGGATHGDTSAPNAQGAAGGFFAGGISMRCVLADSTIKDCYGNRGGGGYGSILIRCYLSGNVCKNMGAAAHSSALWSSIVSGNGAQSVTLEGCSTMMCTVLGNTGVSYAFYDGGRHYNALNVANATRNQSASVTSARNCVIGAQTEAYARDKFEDCVFDVDNYEQVISPATGDFRIVKGSASETAGSAACISAWTSCTIPDADKHLDFFKNPVPKTGTIMAGAIQEAVVPQSGRYTIATAGFVAPFGAATLSVDLWARTETYPAQIRFAKDGLNRPIYCHTVGTATASNYRPTEMDGSVVLTMPPIGVTATGEVLFAQAELYVDPENGKDDDPAHDGSSWAKAYRSVIKAGNSVTQTRTIVHCAAGDYTEANQGSIVLGGHHARIGRTSSTSYSVCYKGAGAGGSVVYGAADPEHLDDGEYGCGPNACCGVYLPAAGDILQGFTIRDGHSSKWSADVDGRDGGNVRAYNTPIIADCIIANGVARRNGAIDGGAYVFRCQFIGNNSYNGTLRSAKRYVSCYFSSNKTSTGTHFYDEPSCMYNCTYVYGAGGGQSRFGNLKDLYNSIYSGNESMTASTFAGGGNVYWGMTGTWDREGCTKLNPAFCDAATEPTLYCFSEALDKGLKPTAENFGANWWKFASTDLDGNLLQYTADGKVRPGCRHALASAAFVEKPTYGSTTAALTNRIDVGTPLTVTYANDSAKPRPFLGIVVDGVTNHSNTASLSAPDGMDGQCYQVSFLANGTNWYVNAAAEDDSGDGFTPETAKKTLKGVFADSYVLAGDCVHAAPGCYDEGEMCVAPFTSGNVSNRVQIAAGITLVGEGADICSIVGAGSPETGANTDSYKRGPGAVKCVYMAANSTLKGFTIVGGRSASEEMSGKTYPSGADYEGGGVRCEDNTTCRIFDCVISNNAAIRSGGVYKGILVNCRIVQNIGSPRGGNMGTGGEGNAFVGCYLGKQVNDGSTFREPKQIDNCTLDGIAISYGVPNGGIRNSLLINLSNTSGSFCAGAATLENCVLDEVSWDNLRVKYATGTWTDCEHYSTEDLKIGVYGRPLKGSPLIDQANGTLAEGYVQKLTDVDADGSQRVYNAALDIGAFEYDWRGDFAAAIGSGAEVTVATPNVELDEATGKVKIPGGEAVKAVLAGTAGRKATVKVQAVTDGELSVSRAGEPLATVTPDQGETPVRYVSTGSDAFDFSYMGAGYGLLGEFLSKTPTAFCLE